MAVVCQDADQKRALIGQEVREMATALDPVRFVRMISGSTFSISNLGMFDVEHFAPINPPEQRF
jgi:pyruvate/2-oxoglutarate dehydrogenase complex dihydrolipoamide acyltransferase (E2) component